jgi:hypothetical protein
MKNKYLVAVRWFIRNYASSMSASRPGHAKDGNVNEKVTKNKD